MQDRLTVEIFTSQGCRRCQTAKDTITRVIDDLGREKFAYREVDISIEIDYAVTLGVLTPSAIAVNGVLIFSSMPSAKKLRQTLLQHILSR